jgi:WhiB family redox-sensing transcriptional regulator
MALNICGHCNVRDLCLDYALQHKEREGIWGGLLPAARNALGASLRYRKKVS